MIDIFIRTYKNDIEWLKYCLKSIHKNVTGYNKIVVCIPINQSHLLDDFNLPNLVTCPVYKDDYLGQQVSKLLADTYCNSEYVLFVDSDCVFHKKFDCSQLFFKGLPVVYKTRYEKVGDAICWKSVTEKTLNKSVEWEYMRRFPLIYRTETLRDLRDYIELVHGRSVENFVLSQPPRHYSEFNALGAYAESFEKDLYHFHDTDFGVDEPFLIQHWSWGGLSEEKRKELEEICK